MKEIALQILGTGEYVPVHQVDSEHFDRAFHKTAGWTFKQTGVRRRAHASTEENVVAMGAAAARDALSNAGISGGQLDLIVSVGSVPAQAIPCTAALLQRALGLAETGTAAFDLNATCLGFLAALDLVAQGIATQRYRTVLLVAAERASIGLNQGDPLTAALFGDGAAAVVIGSTRARHSAILGSLFQTFSLGADYCQIRAGGSLINPHTEPDYLACCYFEMRGRRLYKLVAEKMPGFLQQLLARAGVEMQDINVWVPHQASGHALKHMQDALHLPAERFVSTLEDHGNQVAASLPIALHRGIHSGQIAAGDKVALVGTGAGLSFGGTVLRY